MIIKNCEFCHHYIREEIGDNDFGGIYAEEPSCSNHYDLNENDEPIEGFDRKIERECCELEFFYVLEKDSTLSYFFDLDVKNTGNFNKTYELFNRLYQ